MLINMRRLTMLFMAMFVKERQWLQVMVFIALNFISLICVVVVRPFDTNFLNFLNIFNESMGLIAAYLMLPLQNMEYSPEHRYEIP